MRIGNAIASTWRAPLAMVAALLPLTAAAAPAPWRNPAASFPTVEQLDLSAARQPTDAGPLFPAASRPLTQWLSAARSQPSLREPSSFDVASELMTDDARALASALDAFVRAPRLGAERRRIRRSIAAAYAGRDFARFWSADGRWSAAALSAGERLRDAADDGLNLGAYPLPRLDGAASLDDELALSESVAAYALQASGGRIDPARISGLIGARPDLPDAGGAAARVAAAGARAGETLQDFNPGHYGYRALRAKLVELRAARRDGVDSPRLAAVAPNAADDAEPVGAKAARRAKPARGQMEAEVVANMERWRWLPRDLGASRVEVNIPDFELTVVRDGQVAHRTRVIVGKEETPTPIFSNAVKFIIVNPYWHVPPSIIAKEWGGDVSRAAAKGWKVSYHNGQAQVAQPPGESNALGRIKFIFPNDFAVYMHDTPSRGLFSAARRAFSHGCMRVEEPFALAEAVLGPHSGWSQARVKKLIGEKERYINLDQPLPIHVEYFTTYVDEFGELRSRPDLYGYSARVLRELGLGG